MWNCSFLEVLDREPFRMVESSERSDFLFLFWDMCNVFRVCFSKCVQRDHLGWDHRGVGSPRTTSARSWAHPRPRTRGPWVGRGLCIGENVLVPSFAHGSTRTTSLRKYPGACHIPFSKHLSCVCLPSVARPAIVRRGPVLSLIGRKMDTKCMLSFPSVCPVPFLAT